MSENYYKIIERLELEKQSSEGQSPKRPSRLSLKSIHTERMVFQPRSLEGIMDLSQSHIDTLLKAIKGTAKGTLDEPLDVWWSGSRWILLDGHHRFDAYTLYQIEKKETLQVRVKAHLDMTAKEAVMFATSRNSQDKLQMPQEDKSNAAWRFVCLGVGTKAEQAKAASVSERSVAYMRNVFKSLISKGNPIQRLLDLSWMNARLLEEGEFEPDHSLEALEKQAMEVARRIPQILGPVTTRPDVIARGLKIYSESLPSSLIQSNAWEDDFHLIYTMIEKEGGLGGGDCDDF